MENRKLYLVVIAMASVAYLSLLYTAGWERVEVTVQNLSKWSITNALTNWKDTLCKMTTANGCKPVSQRGHVLIVTYMRSGSSFLGSMFMAHKDIYYVFEPLWTVEEKPPYIPLNGTKRNTSNYEDANLQTLNDIFDCHLQQLTLKTLQGGHWARGTNGTTYKQCAGEKPQRRSVLKCLSILSTPCVGANATVIKTIRVRMTSAEAMLNTDPNLKVINLVRDPRATFSSRIQWGSPNVTNIRAHCGEVYKDVHVTMKLAQMYPDRVRIVYYEDITVDTEKEIRELYKFIGYPFTKDVENHIRKLGAEEGKDFFTLSRKNSTDQLFKWRRTMEYNFTKEIDNNCGDVLDVLGYIPITSEHHLRDLSVSLRIDMKAQV